MDNKLLFLSLIFLQKNWLQLKVFKKQMSSKDCLASTNASSELPFNTGFEPGCTEQGYIFIK